MKAAFVTGAAGDIGRATVRALVAQGWKVAAADLNQQRLGAFAAECGDAVVPIECDITRADSVRLAVAAANEALGVIALLVNNAGGISAPSLRTVTEAQWVADIELNLTGHWRCINAVQEQMISRGGGVIVNVASVNGLGIFGHPGYSAAKAGLIHLTRFAAVELGKFGIRAVAICPGSVRTQAWVERAAQKPEIMDEITRWYPSRAVCEPQDVAAAILHAGSDESRMLNGAVIALDGGLSSGTDRIASLFTGQEI